MEGKRDKLEEQLEEAKKLKECIDKRGMAVLKMLQKYLDSEKFTDYEYFIKMKAKLLLDSRDINEKILLGEEQSRALQETLLQSPS